MPYQSGLDTEFVKSLELTTTVLFDNGIDQVPLVSELWLSKGVKPAPHILAQKGLLGSAGRLMPGGVFALLVAFVGQRWTRAAGARRRFADWVSRGF
jgi:hypothetical protein